MRSARHPDAARDRWAPVAALSVITTAGYGILYYAYGVLLVPMSEDLGWSRTFLSAALSIALVVGAGTAVVVGRWLDGHPPRGLYLAGAVLGAGLCAAWATARSRPVFVLVWALLGTVQAVVFYEPAFTVLTKWFHGPERHRAITTVTLVGGLASTIFAPLTALLAHALGWRHAVLVLGGVLLVAAGPAAWVLPRRPAVASPAPERATPAQLPAEVLRSPSFRLLTTAYLLSAVTTFAVGIQLVAYLHGRGVSTAVAGTVLGAVGLVQVLGRALFVRLSRHPPLSLATWVLAAKGVAIVLLVVLPVAPGVALFVLGYGAANGIATLTRALTVADLYGPENYGVISAVIGAVSSVGGALAPFAAAAVIAALGRPGPVFLGLAALSLAAGACNEVVARPARARARVPVAEVEPAPDLPPA